MDQHGTEDQTHGRAGGVRRTQTGVGERPMIHVRRTHQISPGRQADAIALGHEWQEMFKETTGMEARVSIVITGTLGRICGSWDAESVGAWEATWDTFWASPKGKAFWERAEAMDLAGNNPLVPGTHHDEIWRDA